MNNNTDQTPEQKREELREEFEKETGLKLIQPGEWLVGDKKYLEPNAKYAYWFERREIARIPTPPLSLKELGVSDKQIKKIVADKLDPHQLDRHGSLVIEVAQWMRDKLLPYLTGKQEVEWVSVKDRLPELGENVFAGHDDYYGIYALVIDDNTGLVAWGSCHGEIEGEAIIDDDYSSITHWRPLPVPP